MAQKTLAMWLMATRPQFFTVIISPILLGTAIAWHITHQFSFLYFSLSLFAGLIIHASVNVLNDYFDHGADDLNHTPLTPFAGGSRMIQNGVLSRQETYRYGLALLFVAMGLGLGLVWARGWPLLWIGMIGIFSGYFYSAPPLSFNSRGLGELLVGLNFGILATLGAYYVQIQSFSMQAVFAALPLSFLVAAILYLNEFPDYSSDKQAGKETLVVRLGLQRARPVYGGLIGLNFLSILIGWKLNQLSSFSLLSLLSLPLGMFSIQKVNVDYHHPQALIPAIKSTIVLHTFISAILIIAFLL